MNEEIKKQAKAIMDTFVTALEKANLPEVAVGLDREKPERNPKEEPTGTVFRQRLFKNAPDVDNDCIVAEKKSW